MAVITNQESVSNSKVLVFSAAQGKSLGALTLTMVTFPGSGTATIYVGGINVSTTNGYPLTNGTAPTTGSLVGASVTFAPAVGDLYAIASAAGPFTLAIAYSYLEG